MKKMMELFFNLVYPPICLHCGAMQGIGFRETLCASCAAQIMADPQFLSAGLGPQHGTHYDKAYSACIYEGVVKHAIHEFKYNSRFAAERLFKGLMVGFAEKNMAMGRYDWIVPVPLHRVKERERGFNQSLSLAIGISGRFKIPVMRRNLIKVKPGRPQVELSGKERLESVKGSFTVKRPYLVKNTTLLVIDDVITTGSTANECSRALKEAGAKGVEVFALARSVSL